MAEPVQAAFTRRLNRIYGGYVLGLLLFIAALAGLEMLGLSRRWIGGIFLLATVLVYAGIGLISRTTDADEYYVAGRRVPAVYNGMATAADWMSAASFISLAGTMYLQGYTGLAFIMGWTGGYWLVALLLAPYLRRFGQYTIPDFLGARYGNHGPRLMGVVAAILCSFTYVVAQIYAIGLITSHLTWLSVKQTGVPLPQAVHGAQLEKVTQREQVLHTDPKELEVIALFSACRRVRRQADGCAGCVGE